MKDLYRELWNRLKNDILEEKTSWGKEVLKDKMEKMEIAILRKERDNEH